MITELGPLYFFSSFVQRIKPISYYLILLNFIFFSLCTR